MILIKMIKKRIRGEFIMMQTSDEKIIALQIRE